VNKLVECLQLLWSIVSAVANRSADHRVVFLFHKAVVVLPVRPAARKRDLPLGAVADEVIVDEFTAVVRVNATDRKREPSEGRFQAIKHMHL